MDSNWPEGRFGQHRADNSGTVQLTGAPLKKREPRTPFGPSEMMNTALLTRRIWLARSAVAHQILVQAGLSTAVHHSSSKSLKFMGDV